MGKTAHKIVEDILNFISNSLKCPGEYFKDYYVGITDDPKKALFEKHNVDKRTGCYIYVLANSYIEAKTALKLLLNSGMQNNSSDSDDSFVYVYCYFTTNVTSQ